MCSRWKFSLVRVALVCLVTVATGVAVGLKSFPQCGSRRAGAEISCRANQSLAMPAHTVSSRPEHNCDFAAVLMKTGYSVPDAARLNDPPGPGRTWDTPDGYFYDYIIQRSSASSNPNGYGICYARNGRTGIDRGTQVWNSLNQFYAANPGPLDFAHAAILNPTNQAWMVMAHSRFASIVGGQPTAIGQQHPFYLDWNGKTYALMHNGGLEITVKSPLFGDSPEQLWTLRPMVGGASCELECPSVELFGFKRE